MQSSQENLKTIVYAKFGGQTKCIMDNWKNENYWKTECFASRSRTDPFDHMPDAAREFSNIVMLFTTMQLFH